MALNVSKKGIAVLAFSAGALLGYKINDKEPTRIIENKSEGTIEIHKEMGAVDEIKAFIHYLGNQ